MAAAAAAGLLSGHRATSSPHLENGRSSSLNVVWHFPGDHLLPSLCDQTVTARRRRRATHPETEAVLEAGPSAPISIVLVTFAAADEAGSGAQSARRSAVQAVERPRIDQSPKATATVAHAEWSREIARNDGLPLGGSPKHQPLQDQALPNSAAQESSASALGGRPWARWIQPCGPLAHGCAGPQALGMGHVALADVGGLQGEAMTRTTSRSRPAASSIGSRIEELHDLRWPRSGTAGLVALIDQPGRSRKDRYEGADPWPRSRLEARGLVPATAGFHDQLPPGNEAFHGCVNGVKDPCPRP